MDLQVDLKSLVKSSVCSFGPCSLYPNLTWIYQNEFLRRVEQSSSTIVLTMTTFLRRASLRIVNQSSIPTFIRRVQKASEGSSQADTSHSAEFWLTYVSKHLPALYKLHIGELTKAIADERNEKLVEVSLQALAAAVNWDPKLHPTDKYECAFYSGV